MAASKIGLKPCQKYLKLGNKEEIGKTMSPAKAQRRQEKFRNSNLNLGVLAGDNSISSFVYFAFFAVNTPNPN
ncbi:MAG TPA: hypothetical protein VJ733_08435 [Candidatus Binatia bacterium]|nr:hypothetical protein [Candidatus Binatia bacterium]